jgi:TPP-dependent pyruvate/acetoin dehydrogenase alpha subunit
VDAAPNDPFSTRDADALRRMYALMLTTTLADKRAAAEAKAGRLLAAFYPVRGMEAVCAALGATVRREDKLLSTYRNLGDALAKGMKLRSIVAELYGREAGCSGGRGGSMHLHDHEVGMTATTGIVGSGMPMAVGVAMAEQMDGSGNAVIVTFGDGATSMGAYHESMNFAALWKLPLVFVCQNNQWGEHTRIADYAPNVELAERARSYNMATEKVDGFDPSACVLALDRALSRARAGEGPTFLEFVHYRFTGHTGTADYSYVPKDELERAMQRDPVPSLRAWLLDSSVFDETQIAEIESQVAAEVDDAFEFAASSPPPDPNDVYLHVFADDAFVRRVSNV